MAAIKQTFFQECEEQLAELETGLLAIENGDHDLELVNAVFRAVHSIKGGAGAFSLDDLVHFAHIFENTLDLMRSNRLQRLRMSSRRCCGPRMFWPTSSARRATMAISMMPEPRSLPRNSRRSRAAVRLAACEGKGRGIRPLAFPAPADGF